MNNEELETELITLFISMDHPVNLIEFSDKLKDFILLDREKQKQRMKERVEEEWDHKLKLEVQFIQGKVSQDDAVSDLKQLFFLYKNDLKERIIAGMNSITKPLSKVTINGQVYFSEYDILALLEE